MRLVPTSLTTDFLAVNQGGEVDYALARSVPLGIKSVINDFEEIFRANNLEIVKDTPVLPPERVRIAVSSGHLPVVVKHTRVRKK